MYYIWICTGEIRRYMPGQLMMWIQCRRCYLSIWMLLLQATRLCFNVRCKISEHNVLRKVFRSHNDIHFFQTLLTHFRIIRILRSNYSGFYGIQIPLLNDINIIALEEGNRERFLWKAIDIVTYRTFLLWYIHPSLFIVYY